MDAINEQSAVLRSAYVDPAWGTFAQVGVSSPARVRYHLHP
jgi:hypothetical protein